jgi:hypothetical protein
MENQIKQLYQYQNGNYNVTIFDDGTKIRENDLGFFDAKFPENIDIKITNYCNVGCPMCHEGSDTNGVHGDILNYKFVDTLRPGTELAIGGGMVTSHPQLVEFLCKLKTANIIANITVNQVEYEKNLIFVNLLIERKLVYGVGVSYHHHNDTFWNMVSQNKNAVVHLINGIHGQDVFDYLSKFKLKILVLGYKHLRRGVQLYETDGLAIEKNKKWLHDNLWEYVGHFGVFSFDNLAIKQLDPKRFLSDQQWSEFFMGSDGQHTMYIDTVTGEFAQSSTNMNRMKITDCIDDMFALVKSEVVTV